MEVSDEDDKFKVKSQELGRPLEAKSRAFLSWHTKTSKNAQVKGPQWRTHNKRSRINSKESKN